MSPAMTLSLSSNVATNKVRAHALEIMIRDTPLSYSPQAIPEVHVGWGGVGQGHNECTKDGAMAYQCALLLWATRKNEYAYKVCDILRSWSLINKVFTATDISNGWLNENI